MSKNLKKDIDDVIDSDSNNVQGAESFIRNACVLYKVLIDELELGNKVVISDSKYTVLKELINIDSNKEKE